jgi:nitrate reductase delta subunit
MLTFRVLSALLRYPAPELRAELAEAARILRSEAVLPDQHLQAVCAFITELQRAPQLDAESAYIDAFDRGRSASLYVFEHIHGDSRARGEAMHRLLLRYRAHGLEMEARELPDYLPLFLELRSKRPLAEARRHLAEISDIAALIGRRLRARGAPHAPLLEAIAALAPANAGIIEDISAGERDDTPAALDAAWAEAPVTFNDEDLSANQRSAVGAPHN